MKNLSSYTQFVNESKLQDDYREFFSKLLELYNVKSPAEFKDKEEVSKKFYKDIEEGWSVGNGLTKYGKKLMDIEKLEDLKESINEEELYEELEGLSDELLVEGLIKKVFGKEGEINKDNISEFINKEGLTSEEEGKIRDFTEKIAKKKYVADSPEAGWNRISRWAKTSDMANLKEYLNAAIADNWQGRTEVYPNKITYKKASELNLKSGFGEHSGGTTGA
jgi:hypothetical protein